MYMFDFLICPMPAGDNVFFCFVFVLFLFVFILERSSEVGTLAIS